MNEVTNFLVDHMREGMAGMIFLMALFVGKMAWEMRKAALEMRKSRIELEQQLGKAHLKSWNDNI